MAEVTVEPGAMRYESSFMIGDRILIYFFRELHWHPTQDEWSYFLLVCLLENAHEADIISLARGKDA